MDAPLDAIAVRVLGSLIEKEVTTPDNYPLTLNALVAACNQSSNRDPVTSLDDLTVNRALNDLRIKSLARGVQGSGSRVMRYSQLLTEKLNLDEAERAVMCVLMLRGPQTAGEVRSHGERLFEFLDLPHVERTLKELSERDRPLVKELPRRVGQKEARFAHLLSGDVAADALPVAEGSGGRAPAAATAAMAATVEPRVAALEREMGELRAELAALRAQFEAFRKEFQ